MRRLSSVALATLAIAALSSFGSAQSLTTLFASNNQGSPGGGVYFDITVTASIAISQLDINTAAVAGSAGTLDVFVIQNGNYSGNEANAGAWTQVATAEPFTAAGIDVPTTVMMTNPVILPPGSHALALGSSTGHAYTNGNGTNQTYMDPFITLSLGSATNVIFSGAPFTPRVWNGTIYYTPGMGFASATPYGQGCGAGAPPGFYELFDGTNPFDLSGTSGGPYTSWVMNAALPGYVVTPGANVWFTPTSANLGLGDDQTVQVTLPFAFPYQGGVTNDLWVCSNGYVFLESSTVADFSESVAELLAGPARVCPLWDDLNPSAGGSVHFDIDPSGTKAYVTFIGVPEFGTAAGSNDFQVSFDQSGTMELVYGSVSSLDSLVGFSPGNGAADPGPTDISMIAALQTGTGRGDLTLSSDRPVIGTTFNVVTSEIPLGSTFGSVNLSFGQIPPPGMDLTPIGMTGCAQYITLAGASTILNFPTLSTQTDSFTILNNPSLAGLHVYVQAAVWVPAGINPLGVTASNAIDWLIDIN